jgi:hypothetical protein
MKYPNITFTIILKPEDSRLSFQATNENLSKEDVLKALDELRNRIHNDEYLTEEQGSYADGTFPYADKILAEQLEEIDDIEARTKARHLFLELEKRNPSETDYDTISMMAKALKFGYKLAREKYYTPMCDDCGYRSATCFGPGAFCEECSMKDENNDFEEGNEP